MKIHSIPFVAAAGASAAVMAAMMSTSASAFAFHPGQHRQRQQHLQQRQWDSVPSTALQMKKNNDENKNNNGSKMSFQSTAAAFALGLVLSTSTMFGAQQPAFADTPKSYDGFAEYAKENQMEKSDVGCFINKCGDQTKALFSNPRGIKGVSCLGRCKGEQSCCTRCFAEFSSPDLDNWLSCAIEENECVKAPKNIDNSAENAGYSTVVRNFDPKSLLGKWYKTYGLDPNYDLFDCQSNIFTPANDDASELDMDIFLRIRRPESAGGGYWENDLKEHMIVDAVLKGDQKSQAESVIDDSRFSNEIADRTMHTQGKMYGLEFYENWFILGESDGKGAVPEFKLVAFKGHTLQGNYEGSFVYSKEKVLPEAAIPAVREAAAKAGLDWDQYTQIDNTCPVGEPLNDSNKGTGTSTSEWIDLVVGPGGVIDWISPGWRGEYKK